MAYLPGFYQLIAQQNRDLEKTSELIPGSAASAVTMLASSTCMFILHCKSVWWHHFHCGGSPVPMRMNCRWWKAGRGLGTRLLWWHNEDHVTLAVLCLMRRDFDETMAALPPYCTFPPSLYAWQVTTWCDQQAVDTELRHQTHVLQSCGCVLYKKCIHVNTTMLLQSHDVVVYGLD